jgi:hypothetical protein
MSGCYIAFDSNFLPVFLPYFFYISATRGGSSKKPIKRDVLSTIVAVECSMMDLVKHVSHSRYLEAIMA